MGFRRNRFVVAMPRKRKERWHQCCPLLYDLARWMHPPPVECYVIKAFSIASDFDPKQMPWRTKSDHDEKNLHRQTILSFASSKSLLWLLLELRETPHASHIETEVKRCLRRDQRRAARATWVQCMPSTLRYDSKSDELACCSKKRAQPFLLSHCRSKDNRACLPGFTL